MISSVTEETEPSSVISSLIRRFREHAPSSSEERKQVVSHDHFWWLQQEADEHQKNANKDPLDETAGEVMKSSVGDLNSVILDGNDSDSNGEELRHLKAEIEPISCPSPVADYASPDVATLRASIGINSVTLSSVDTAVTSSTDLDLDRYTAKLLVQCEGLLQEYKGVPEVDLSHENQRDTDGDRMVVQESSDWSGVDVEESVDSSIVHAARISDESIKEKSFSTTMPITDVEISDQNAQPCDSWMIPKNANESAYLEIESVSHEGTVLGETAEVSLEEAPRVSIPRPMLKSLHADQADITTAVDGSSEAAAAVVESTVSEYGTSSAEAKERPHIGDDSATAVTEASNFMYLSPTSSVASSLLVEIQQDELNGMVDTTKKGNENLLVIPSDTVQVSDECTFSPENEQQDLVQTTVGLSENDVKPFLHDDVVQYLWRRLVEIRARRFKGES